MKNALTQAESERETELGLLKEVVKKLLHALEDKSTTDLIANNHVPLKSFQTNNNDLPSYTSPTKGSHLF